MDHHANYDPGTGSAATSTMLQIDKFDEQIVCTFHYLKLWNAGYCMCAIPNINCMPFIVVSVRHQTEITVFKINLNV